MRCPLLALFAALLTLGLTAASASAARWERVDGAIKYSAVDGESVDITVRAGSSSNLQLNVQAALGTTVPTAIAPCFGSGLVRTCALNINGVVVSELRFETASGDDKITASALDKPFNASLPEEFVTGDGVDVLVAGPLGDDVRAGSGGDTITGGPGPDVLRGEGGDDTFLGLDGDDTVTGGDGADLLDLSAVDGGMAISLNGAEDDGFLGGLGNVDVENVRGTAQADLLTGGDGANSLEGGDGNDVIDVRDGGADDVDCGPGVDRVIVDALDGVSGCELVEREVPGGGAAGGGGPGGAGGGVLEPLVDRDRDGVLPPADCDDTSATERPGARDVPGNGIDEDCNGADAALQRVPSRLAFNFAGFRDGTEARTLRVRDVPRGGKVELRCSGRGCGFARRKVKAGAAGTANLLKLIKGRRLPAGLVIEVRVSAPETIAAVTRFTMRSRGRLPVKRSLCLPPGESQPTGC